MFSIRSFRKFPRKLASLLQRSTGKLYPEGAEARIGHSSHTLTPSLSVCVFALLKNMFGEQQMSVLKDYIQAALMLRSNKRIVG